ncbi:MAG: 16S rRNA processing protein RimM [Candidatus Aminicenantes bacterium]|nr:16S rRNA processing protein RimM [Candidatus Aminicenantes bacterium]
MKVEGTLQEYQIGSVRLFRNFYIVKLQGVENIGQAQALVGCEVQAPEADFGPLEKDSYYFHQLEGLSVKTKSGRKIGIVRDVLGEGGNEVLLVASGKEDVLIPFVASICIEVDMAKNTIVIDPPEGLLELNEI